MVTMRGQSMPFWLPTRSWRAGPTARSLPSEEGGLMFGHSLLKSTGQWATSKKPIGVFQRRSRACQSSKLLRAWLQQDKRLPLVSQRLQLQPKKPRGMHKNRSLEPLLLEARMASSAPTGTWGAGIPRVWRRANLQSRCMMHCETLRPPWARFACRSATSSGQRSSILQPSQMISLRRRSKSTRFAAPPMRPRSCHLQFACACGCHCSGERPGGR
mmetsp:Transcript_59852/g.155662  ORF Transcript_59852/g.155662 Transcript_59852/m.155662 type:complete len:215 (+) Transcript_59852:677-1321(+)